MVKINRQSDIPLRKEKHKTEEKSNWFINLFKSKKKDDEELTFATKHKKAKSVDKKRMTLYFVLGLVVISSLGAIAIPLIQQLQASKPEQQVQADNTLDSALDKLKENKKDIDTKKIGEDIDKTTKSKDNEIKDDNQEAVNKKVQEELDKATAKVVDEYNKKLKEATSRVQTNNEELATTKAENEALQKQVNELKKQLEEAKQVRSSDRLALPGQ